MPNMRSKDQKATAVSISVELYAQAQVRASKENMSVSGFLRYCLAKELGYNEEYARDLGQHEAVRKLIARGISKIAGMPMNDGPNSAALSAKKLLEKGAAFETKPVIGVPNGPVCAPNRRTGSKKNPE